MKALKRIQELSNQIRAKQFKVKRDNQPFTEKERRRLSNLRKCLNNIFEPCPQMRIKESDVLELIGQAIDDLDMDGLAKLHNQLAADDYDHLSGDDIEPCEDWHLIPKEGAH